MVVLAFCSVFTDWARQTNPPGLTSQRFRWAAPAGSHRAPRSGPVRSADTTPCTFRRTGDEWESAAIGHPADPASRPRLVGLRASGIRIENPIPEPWSKRYDHSDGIERAARVPRYKRWPTRWAVRRYRIAPSAAQRSDARRSRMAASSSPSNRAPSGGTVDSSMRIRCLRSFGDPKSFAKGFPGGRRHKSAHVPAQRGNLADCAGAHVAVLFTWHEEQRLDLWC